MKQHLQEIKERVPFFFCLKFKVKPPVIFLVIWMVSCVWSNQGQAQHHISVDNEGSDYQTKATFSGLSDERCDCSQTRSIKGYLGSARNGTAAITKSGLGTSGSFHIVMGPSHNTTYYWTAHYDGSQTRDGCLACFSVGVCTSKPCAEHTDITSFVINTAAIKSPHSLTASNGAYDNKIILTWAKGSDIPDDKLEYKIYRDEVHIATIDPEGAAGLTYTDTNRQPGVTHTYKVATFTNDWGNQESVKSSVTGSTFSVSAVASAGEFHNRVKLTWNNVSSKGAEEIKIERSIPGGSTKEELAIVNKNASTYSDYDGIPGFNYIYTVTPLAAGKTFLPSTSTGYRSPNGVIKGTVKSKLNAGVPGITVTITVKTTNLTAGASNYGASSTYTAVTDSAGAYEISGVYYYKNAEFYITPTKTNHVFSPSRLTKRLDLNSPSISAVDFTDETVYTISGKINFNNTTCGVKNVDIYLNGKNTGIKTDFSGRYALAVQDEGTYTIMPKFLHHAFINTGGNNSTRTINVDGDELNQDFSNTQTDNLEVNVKTGCQSTMGVATIRITSTDPANCYNQTFTTNASGVLNQVLPAQEYNVEVIDLDNSNKVNILRTFEPQIIDLRQRDTLEQINKSDTTYTIIPASSITLSNGTVINTPADTTGFTVKSDTSRTAIAPKIDFLYRGQLTLLVHNLPDPEPNCSPQVMLMERSERRIVRIEVLETHGNSTCRVDSGMVTIYDGVGDKGISRHQIKNGEVFYALKAGDPNLAVGHKKLFEVFAQVGQRTANLAKNIIVTGVKPLSATFTTKTPELPFMVLHDPPGDASYSYLAKDSTFTTTLNSQLGYGGNAGGLLNLKHGGGVTLPYVGKIGAALLVDVEAQAGRDNIDEGTYTSSFKATQQFSTSGVENFVGGDGDVIVGASMNIVFSKAMEVKYDKVKCALDVDTTILWDPTDFASTNIYTEKHIKNTLLPQLKDLKKISVANGDGLRAEELENAIGVWNQTLKNNENNRNKAIFKENISFSSGATYDKSITTSSDTTTSFTFNIFFNFDFFIGTQMGAGDWNETKYGLKTQIRVNTSTKEDETVSRSKTIGYHLEDDDPGDFFSVDIGEDRVFGTPTFKIKAGTSMCPHEDGTQPRFTPQIELTSNAVSNVPQNQPATFTALITNLSESGEARQYDITVISETNPDGAIISLGGQQINQDPVSYYIPYGATIPVTLTVEQGPLASTYEDLKIMIYPECELELWKAGGKMHNADTVTFSAYFQSQCSEVSLVEPSNNWLIKQSNNNKILLTLGNYDASNSLLKNIQIQYRQAGGEWLIATTILKESLVEDFYGYEFDVSGLADGNYEFRAKANCGSGSGFTYSSVLNGIIDRATIAPFGTATPADGFLQPGQKISVMFDKSLKPLTNYNSEQISLTRIGANGETITIPTIATIVNNQELLIKTNPETLINSVLLRGTKLTATVSNIQDTNGNVQKYPVIWSFQVEKPVFWDPDTLIASVTIGSGKTISSELKNATQSNKRFTLIKYPTWLKPSVLKGVIQPAGLIKVEFAISTELKPGVYKDVVEAEIDGVKEVMPVTLELLAVPVSWTVNPGNYNYSMNIVAQYSLSSANTPTSVDERDVIAAFVNGVPRGVAKIRKIDGMPGKFAAFLTVYSDEAGVGKETITFRMWNALTGVEYGALEKPAFQVDGILGTAATPYLLHPEGTFQVIPLKKGWNWVSFNVATSDMTREKVFSSLLSSGNNITIKDQTNFSNFSPQSGWSGTLRTVDLTTGYMLHLSDKPDTLRVVGNTPATFTPISLTTGWNWIGFPKIKNTDVKTALGTNFTAKNGDFLKSFTSFATFTTPANLWIGDLKTMDPGQSYKLKVSAPTNLAYRKKATDGSNFEVDEHKFEYTLTLTGMLNLNGMPVVNNHYSVGAYIKGVCRGFSSAEYSSKLKANRIFLTIYGEAADAGEIIEFRIFNSLTGEEITAENKGAAFLTDKIVGEMEKPYILNFNDDYLEGGFSLSQNKPNPFQTQTTIDYTIPEDIPVEITLYDNLGKQVKVLEKGNKTAGNYSILLESNKLPSGIYIYRLKAGNYVKTRRLVIVR